MGSVAVVASGFGGEGVAWTVRERDIVCVLTSKNPRMFSKL